MTKKLTCIIGGFTLAFGLSLLWSNQAYAETVLEDVDLNLSVEVQDLLFDFDDTGKVIQNDRLVIYHLEVANKGSHSHKDLQLFMDVPNYMEYIPQSTVYQGGDLNDINYLDDIEGRSPLALGYAIESLSAGGRYLFEIAFVVTVPEVLVEDELYTVAWASLVGPYSAIPVLSNPVNNIISGSPYGQLAIKVVPIPEEGTVVFSGSTITYQYQLTNSGGLPIEDVELVTYVPAGTECVENCGTMRLTEDLGPGETVNIDMTVQVVTGDPDQDFIINIGFDVSTAELEYTEIRKEILHPLNAEIQVGSGEFTLLTEQVPNLVLNSPNGLPRADQGDISETQYALLYTGTGIPNVYRPYGDFGISPTGTERIQFGCKYYTYPHRRGATVYAYNSSGGGCEKMTSSCIASSPIAFEISTTLPGNRPTLIMLDSGTLSKTEIYSYGDTDSMNRYMQSGGTIKVPEDFTLARAIEDGALGFSTSFAKAVVMQDLWVYADTGGDELLGSCDCGEDCSYDVYRDVYEWMKMGSSNIQTLLDGDDDETQIGVYGSTAWLKTEGGHVGTNDAIINSETDANRVILQFGGGTAMTPNEYVYDPDTILTPSGIYTPEHEGVKAANADYMIYAGGGNEAFTTSAGENWIQTDTQFDFMERGEAYNRDDNPRSYEEDLLVREKYGPVRTDQLPAVMQGTIDIGDGIVWHQTGDVIIGTEGVNDTVYFDGGQSRLYVDGDVYINANVFYAKNAASNYNEITSLRIDARNIYVSGEVNDLEILLQARESFHSGESYSQLRILGDVITGQASWERKPLLEVTPDEINRPSEYIIEDLRKYVIPVPGDTELPDEYDVWRQVNPGTGQALDSH